jgi:serine/threonine protein phosphatase PrpC
MIILASDGLWEFMTNEECVAMAARRSQPRDAVQDLILEANARWMKEDQVIDDTTVCVAYLGGWSGGGSGRRRSSSSYT